MLARSTLALVVLAGGGALLAFAAGPEPVKGTDPKAADAKLVCAEMTNADAMAKFKKQEGVWDAEVSFWLQPGAKPIATKAVCTSRLILDGRFLEQKIEGGDFGPEMGNKKWSSLSITGFNETTKQFEAVRFGSMSSVMIPVKGAYATDLKSITMSGEYTFMGGKATSRDVVVEESDDVTRIESYMSFAGMPEFKGAEMKLVRRK